MEYLLFDIRNWDGTFTVRYKELEWNIKYYVQGTGIEHLLLDLRYSDEKLNVRLRNFMKYLLLSIRNFGWYI